MGQKKTVSSRGAAMTSGTLLVLAILVIFLAALAVIFFGVPAQPAAPTGETSPSSPAGIAKDGALTASVRAEPRTFNRLVGRDFSTEVFQAIQSVRKRRSRACDVIR